MNIRLLKAVDKICGVLLVKLALYLHPTSQRDFKSFLIIRPGGIGDAVLLIPVVIAIKTAYPNAIIDVLAEKRNGAIFGICSYVRNLYHYDKPLELLRAVQGSYNVVIDSEQWYCLSAVVARLTRAPMLIGFATNDRSRLFTHRVSYSHDNYEIESFFNLLAPLEIQCQALKKFLEIPPAADERADSLLAVIDGNPFVTIFPGASIPERRWGAERFRRVAEMLYSNGISVVVVGGREDHGQGELIVFDGVGLNLAGRTSLIETAAVIDKSALLVSGDSGVLHIAVGLGKPTVSLFGPGRAKKWAPRGDRHIVINKELPCAPCTTFGTTPPCPIGARCMAEIGAEEVFNAVCQLLTREGIAQRQSDKGGWDETVPADVSFRSVPARTDSRRS